MILISHTLRARASCNAHWHFSLNVSLLESRSQNEEDANLEKWVITLLH